MCNCFGAGKKKDKSKDKDDKENEKMSNKSIQKALKAATSNAKNTAPKIAKPSPQSALSNLRSSPSGMKTTELTEVFKISNQQTMADIAASHGYELGEEIGKGSFATVYRAKRKRDGKVMACKVMRTHNARRNMSAKNELFIIQRTQHPHIIKLYGHFIVELGTIRFVFICMELAEGDSLSVYMRSKHVRQNPLSEGTCKRVAAQIISAMNHMHSKGIAHCDLKMGNCLLDKEFNCLVADFGLSRVAYRASKGGTQMSSKFCGTRSYMAPEILLIKEYSDIQYNPFVADVWALGVLLWCVINQKYPFDVDSPNVLEKQLSHQIKFSKKLTWEPSKEVYDFFYQTFEPKVDERIKMSELMSHPWVASEVRLVEEKVKETTSPSTSSSTSANANTSPSFDSSQSNTVCSSKSPSQLPTSNATVQDTNLKTASSKN